MSLSVKVHLFFPLGNCRSVFTFLLLLLIAYEPLKGALFNTISLSAVIFSLNFGLKPRGDCSLKYSNFWGWLTLMIKVPLFFSAFKSNSEATFESVSWGTSSLTLTV